MAINAEVFGPGFDQMFAPDEQEGMLAFVEGYEKFIDPANAGKDVPAFVQGRADDLPNVLARNAIVDALGNHLGFDLRSHLEISGVMSNARVEAGAQQEFVVLQPWMQQARGLAGDAGPWATRGRKREAVLSETPTSTFLLREVEFEEVLFTPDRQKTGSHLVRMLYYADRLPF